MTEIAEDEGAAASAYAQMAMGVDVRSRRAAAGIWS